MSFQLYAIQLDRKRGRGSWDGTSCTFCARVDKYCLIIPILSSVGMLHTQGIYLDMAGPIWFARTRRKKTRGWLAGWLVGYTVRLQSAHGLHLHPSHQPFKTVEMLFRMQPRILKEGRPLLPNDAQPIDGFAALQGLQQGTEGTKVQHKAGRPRHQETLQNAETRREHTDPSLVPIITHLQIHETTLVSLSILHDLLPSDTISPMLCKKWLVPTTSAPPFLAHRQSTNSLPPPPPIAYLSSLWQHHAVFCLGEASPIGLTSHFNSRWSRPTYHFCLIMTPLINNRIEGGNFYVQWLAGRFDHVHTKFHRQLSKISCRDTRNKYDTG